MKTIRDTENRIAKLTEEVDRMQVGRSVAIQNLIAQVEALRLELKAHMADKKAHKD